MLSNLVLAGVVLASPGSLETGFKNPPEWARPHTWWHWMAGNATREGITEDLRAMKFAGIGGAHIFDVGQGIPSGPVAYNSPEWRDLMAHAVQTGERLGLEMTVHNCSGWSSSGGPWVQPEDAMKKVVWSLTRVSGEAEPVKLDPPSVVGGYYRDIAAWVLPGDAPEPASSIGSFVGLGGNPGVGSSTDWPVILTGEPMQVGPDGTLSGQVEGAVRVLRLGYTLTGAQNVASRPTGQGLEVDKLSADSLDRFLAGGLDPLFERIGAPEGKAQRTVLIDSYETGFQNWTPTLIEDFKRLRGYDPTPYLPALAGYAVKDRDTTREFLFDFRRTLADLWAQNYSGRFADRLKARGMKLAIEPYGNGSFEPFSYAKAADLIMGEYWIGEGQIHGSVKQSASVAHVLGRSVVGAEALTAGPESDGWRNQPRVWKPFADRSFANGINRIIYHRFAHQPWMKGVLPGMTMGPWGSHVDRTQTFWSYMPKWNRYLSRCQFMLQSGRFVGDILAFTGEGTPQEYAGQGHDIGPMPLGYDYDLCGLAPLMDVQARNGKLVLPSGLTYSVLKLPNTDQMTVALARKVRSLVRAGATVVGPRPVGSPSLADGSKGDDEVAAIGKELWGAGGVRTDGVLPALKTLGVPPDFQTSARKVSAIHRQDGATDVYFVTSEDRNPRTVRARFRATGRVPELWDPVDGSIRDASVWRRVPGGTEVELSMEGHGSVFVVFRRAAGNQRSVVDWSIDQPVRPQPQPPALRIVKAEYGVLDQPGKSVDVTDRVQAAVEGGGVEISASNAEMGGDPAFNIVKALRVAYIVGGKTFTRTVPENALFSAGTLTTSQESKEIDLKNGQIAFFRDGRVDIKWSDERRLAIDVRA
ncbi:MAG TPA: glycosyl hydrolase, partial [Fimbriimonas sp.]